MLEKRGRTMGKPEERECEGPLNLISSEKEKSKGRENYERERSINSQTWYCISWYSEKSCIILLETFCYLHPDIPLFMFSAQAVILVAC